MKLISAAVIALVTVSAPLAHAGSRSWSAVKGLLPDHVNVVVGADLSALRGTSLYQSIVPRLIAKEPDAQQAFDLARTTCAIDLHAALVDATVAMGDDERGVIVAALDRSIDQKRVLGCITKLVAARASSVASLDAKGNAPATGGLRAGAKSRPAPKSARIAKAPPPPKVVAKTTGKITEYGLDNDPRRLYVAWLASDVVALATDPEDRALLEKMLSGKGTRGTINTFLSKAGSSAPVWLATTKQQPNQMGGTMKGAFGTIDTAKGNVDLDMNIIMGSPKEAKSFVDQATALLASAKSAVPPQFVKLVDALKVSAAADAANMKLVASEKDVLGLVMLAMMNL